MVEVWQWVWSTYGNFPGVFVIVSGPLYLLTVFCYDVSLLKRNLFADISFPGFTKLVWVTYGRYALVVTTIIVMLYQKSELYEYTIPSVILGTFTELHWFVGKTPPLSFTYVFRVSLAYSVGATVVFIIVVLSVALGGAAGYLFDVIAGYILPIPAVVYLICFTYNSVIRSYGRKSS